MKIISASGKVRTCPKISRRILRAGGPEAGPLPPAGDEDGRVPQGQDPQHIQRGNFRTSSKGIKKIFLAIGVFDGIHRGHQSLIKSVVTKATNKDGRSMVMTFDPHPVQVLHPEIYCPLLISLSHRLKLIDELGVDLCMIVPFTKKFSQLNPEEFIENFLIKKINPKEVFVGDDFRFGHDRSGDLKFFQEAARRYGFKVNIVSAVKDKSEAISSTRIRKLIAAGNLLEASELLGRLVSVFGPVVKGDGRGKKLGFPTANVDVSCDLLPPCGVYLVYVVIDQKRFPGLANVGVRPSFNGHTQANRIVVEAHLLGFKRNIYGQKVIVEFIRKLREEIKFSSPENLVHQINLDERKARKYFQNTELSEGKSKKNNSARKSLRLKSLPAVLPR